MSAFNENILENDDRAKGSAASSALVSGLSETCADTSLSSQPTGFDFMSLPPELRLYVYDHSQNLVRSKLPLRGLEIYQLDLYIGLLGTSHHIKNEATTIMRKAHLRVPPAIIFCINPAHRGP
jgi:hypothetical protein